MRVALIQLTVSDDPESARPTTLEFVDEAAGGGARLILTPEVTNCVSLDRAHQRHVLRPEADDRTLQALRNKAREHGVWILVGSLALAEPTADGRFVNRSFLLTPDGEIAARYDKIHMFDVDISDTESYRESSGYQPGDTATLAAVDTVPIGMTVCYDLRFPGLYRHLAQAGARILTVPSAFSPKTGAAHWETLLCARAIENGAFVLAPAQTGTHPSTTGPERRTYGHSLAIGPWGDVLADAGVAPGVTLVDLRLSEVDRVRGMVPSIMHDRHYTIG